MILIFFIVIFILSYMRFRSRDRIIYDDLKSVREDAIPIDIYTTHYNSLRHGSPPDTTVIFDDGTSYITRESITRNGITYYDVADSIELLGLIRQNAIDAHDKLLSKKRKKFPEL